MELGTDNKIHYQWLFMEINRACICILEQLWLRQVALTHAYDLFPFYSTISTSFYSSLGSLQQIKRKKISFKSENSQINVCSWFFFTSGLSSLAWNAEKTNFATIPYHGDRDRGGHGSGPFVKRRWISGSHYSRLPDRDVHVRRSGGRGGVAGDMQSESRPLGLRNRQADSQRQGGEEGYIKTKQ